MSTPSQPSVPMFRVDIPILAVALCLLAYALTQSLRNSPNRTTVAKDAAVQRPVPKPPQDKVWQQQQEAQHAQYKSHLEDLLKSVTTPRQILLPAASTQDYQRRIHSTHGTPQAGISEWWIAHSGPGQVKMSPGGSGPRPSASKQPEADNVRWHDRHLIANRATFDWSRVLWWNRSFMDEAHGSVRILYTSWKEEPSPSGNPTIF